MNTQHPGSLSADLHDTCGWRIGVATCDITPAVGATLVGYIPRISERIDTPLRSECLYCVGDTGAWLLISCEIIALPRHHCDVLRQQIASRTGVPFGAILVTSTHTHSGPRTLGLENDVPNEIDLTYITFLMDRLVDLACRAVANANPGCFKIHRSQARQWMSNRRVEQPDGSCINIWQDPEGTHTGYVDPLLTIITVIRPDQTADQTSDLVIVSYGCHPVVLGPDSHGVSGDYVAYLKRELEARHIASTAMFLLAPCGDINPRVCITNSPEMAEKMGTELAEVVEKTIRHPDIKASVIHHGTVRAASVEWEIKRTRAAIKLPHFAHSKCGDTFCTCMTALSAGDLCFVGLPGEPFSQYRQWIASKSPFDHTIVVAMSQDFPGYFPTDQAQAQGGYETTMAPAEQMQQVLIDHALHAIHSVYAT